MHHTPATLCLLGACALFAPSGQASAQGLVTLYEHASFGGSVQPLPLQAFAALRNLPVALGAFNDETTSLTWNLAPNVSVTLYENTDGSGRQYRIAHNAVRVGFVPNVGSTYNDSFSSFSWQLDDPSVHGTVTLHQDAGLAGLEKRLPLSSYDEGVVHKLFGYEDEATSLDWDLAPDIVVTFYENDDGTGREYTIRHDWARNGNVGVLASRYNDKFSSWRWDYVDPSEGWIKLWTDANYAGYQLTRYVSETGTGTINFGQLGMNDQVDSFRWDLPPNRTMLLYDKNPVGGACYSLTGAGQRDVRQSPVFHDKISNLVIVDGDYSADLADRNRPYDRNTYLASHNAHCAPALGWLTWNQDLRPVDQLDYGARCMQLDTLTNNGQIYLVHGTWTETLLQRGGLLPQTLQVYLNVLEGWMNDHPREVLTLIFENHDGQELADYLLNQSPIKDKLHLQERGTWPSINELLAQGKRYVIFNMQTQANGLPWQYQYCVENEYSSWFNSAPRSESAPINRRTRNLFFMNNINALPPNLWPPGTTPNDFGSLVNLGNTFSQIPNFIGVDRIREGGEGAADYARYCNSARWLLAQNEATFASFGPLTCGGRLLEGLNRPLLGSTLLMQQSNLSMGPNAYEFLIYGESDVSYGGLPLPFAMPLELGCTVRVSPDIIVPISGFGAQLNFGVSLPATPALNGRDAFFQTIGYEPTADEFVMSNGTRARLGLQ